ncbi:MAG: UbiA family prenyltransferase [Candidatus Micrarchaeaceae archaeon]
MKAKAFVKLTRIEHSFMLIVAVLTAELLAKAPVPYWKYALSIIPPVLISASAFAINNYYDVESDEINKRTDNPIVVGEVSRKEALYVAVAFFALGSLISLPLGALPFLIVVLFGILSLLYSYKMKNILLVGNLYIALSMSIPFIYGSIISISYVDYQNLLIFVIVLLSGLAREIHGTIRDLSGDIRARNAMTLPRLIGAKGSSEIACSLYLIAIAISAVLFLKVAPFKFNLVYLPFVIAANSLLIYASIIFLKEKKEEYRKARNMSLLGMAIALIGFFASALFYVP